MNSKKRNPLLTRFIAAITFLMTTWSMQVHATTISGPTAVYTNTTYTYTYNSGIVYGDGLWTVVNGVDQSETISGSLYTLTATFNTAGTATVKFYNGATLVSSLTVTVTYAPATPNATTTTSYSCGTTTITRTNNPPSGTDWYWETVNNGTSTSLGNGASVNITTNNTTLYLRARQQASPYTWSVSSQSVGTITVFTTTPGMPSGATTYNLCGSGSKTLSVSIGSGGDQVQWFNVPSGGSPVGTGTSYTTPTLSSSAGYYAASVISASGCQSSRLAITVNVNPVPAPISTANGTTCGTGSVTLRATSDPGDGITQWYAGSGGGTAFATSNSYTATFSSTTTYYVTTLNSTTGCETSPRIPVTATVNPMPSVSVQSKSICDGSLTSVAISGSAGATFSWTLYSSNNVAGAGAGSGSLINQTLSLSTDTTTPGSATYTVTPTYNGCVGPSQNFTVTVNPNPVASAPTQSVCSGGTVTVTPTSSVSGTTYSWTYVQTNASGASVSSGSSLMQTLTATTNTAGTVAYTLTPMAGTCQGNSFPLSVTVNPIPVLTAAASQSTCAGDAMLVATSSVSNTSLSWTASNAINVTGAYNASQQIQFDQVLGTSSATGGTINYAISSSAAGCNGNTVNVTLAVYPVPSINAASASICSGHSGSVTITDVSLPGTPLPDLGYQWMCTNTNIASPVSSGTGVPGGTFAVADGINAGTATYTITPVTAHCSGTARTATINVNPLPDTPTGTLAATVCTGQSVTFTPTLSGGADKVQWYDGTTLLATAASHTFSNVAASSTYQAYGFISSTGCPSAVAATVSVTAKTSPAPLVGYSYAPIFGSGQGYLTSSVADLGSGYEAHWYDAAMSGTLVGTLASYTTPALMASRSYYVCSYDPNNQCESSRTQVDVNVLPATGPTVNVTVQNIRTEGLNADNQLYNLNESQQTIQQSYLDGLQREVQRIAQKSSPQGNDIIAPTEYDSYGRTSRNYLPYVNGTAGIYHSGYAIEQNTFYNTSADKIADDPNPYAIARFETSPIGRVLEQGGTGQAWQPVSSGTPHTKRIYYSYNNGATADPKEEVRLFNSDGTSSGYYAANTLMRTQATDANGNIEITYTDGRGRVMAKKKQLDETIGGTMVSWLESYYIYDDLDRLKYVLPPKATASLKSNSWSLSQTILNNLCFQFVYDYRGRTTQKKTPGQAVTYIVYDNLNRPVLSQNGYLRTTNQWAFTKYDVRNRVVMTGLYTDNTNTTVAQMQTLANTLYTAGNGTYPAGSFFETRGTTLHGYTNTSFPKTNADGSALTIYAVSYYDNYDFDNNGTDDFSYTTQAITGEGAQGRSTGLPTGNKTLNLGNSTWLYSYVFYDKYGRAIQARGNNHLSATIDNIATTGYDFEGKKLATKVYHNAGGTNQATVANRFTYDNKGRLLKVYQTNNTDAEQLVAQYDYNELGQVVDKKLHNTTGTTFLQSVDYRYSIQGWLTSVNNAQLTNDSNITNDDTNDYFGMELLYQSADAALGNTADYAGNVSAIKWKGPNVAAGATGQESYNYTYDKSGKLKAAAYKMYGASAWDQQAGAFNESMAFDHGGNMATLARYQNQHGLSVSGSTVTVTNTAQQIDNLTYSYANAYNVLTKVDDAAANTNCFSDGASATTEYSYNSDGSLTADQNKGISAIVYNALGKARQINFTDGRTVVYTYDAAGNKLKMAATQNSTTTTTDYVNGFVYTNSTLSFFSSPEGRVVKNTSGLLEYQYAISDHQGNTRVVFTSATPTAQQVIATFETANQTTEATQFSNYGHITAGHATSTPGNSQYLNGNASGMVGVARSYKVFPGDQLKIEAYGSYNAVGGSSSLATFASALLTAFSLAAPVQGETGTASSALSTWGGIEAGGYGDGSTDNTDPKAFVNIVLFDQNYNFLDVAYAQLKETSLYYMTASYTVKEPGYAYLYVSNEQAVQTDVYFDDVKMTYTPTNIIQSNDYYAFGLQHNTSWTRDNSSNNFLYDGGSEINTTTNWYDLPARNYDPALGRFFQIDPLAHADHTLTPFHYAGNNPIGFNDPTGLIKRYDANGGMGDWEDDAGNGPVRNHDGGGESGGVPMSGDWVPEWTVYSGDEFREMAMRSGFWLSTDAGMVIGDPTKLEVTIRGIRDKFISNVLQEIWDQSSASDQVLQAGFFSDYGSSTLDLLIGSASFQLGKDIEKGRGWFKGTQAWGDKWRYNNPQVRVTNPIKNFNVNASTALRTASVLKVGGLVLGGYGLYSTYADWRDGKTSDGEAALDGFFGLVGFAGPWGMAASATYFLIAKPLYNYATSD